jgi:hypothetical protein
VKFMLLHRTDAYFEGGGKPDRALVERVGKMMGAWAREGRLLDGDGLASSARGVRLTCARGATTTTKGPFTPGDENPAGFATLQVATIDEAVDWATRLARAFGDVEIDVRPCNEAWDIGLAEKPADAKLRCMALYKATPASETGAPPPPAVDAWLAEAKAAGVLQKAATLQPTSKGARVRRAGARFVVKDGPFAEAKELIGGYGIVVAASLAEASAMAERYIECCDVDSVDVRPVADAR